MIRAKSFVYNTTLKNYFEFTQLKMPVKLGYKSVHDGGGGKKIYGKRVISRLRLINFFGKKGRGDHGRNKPTEDDDNRSISDTTADLSPSKGEEDDLDKDRFDIYFASSYLPHVPVDEKDELDLLVEKPSIHSQAFAEAGEMEVPPLPPLKARTRKKSTCDQFRSSKVYSGSSLRSINLMNTFNNVSEITKNKASNVMKQRATAVPTTVVIEGQPKDLNNAKQHLITFGNDLIDAVEHTHSDFNLMLKRISSDKKSLKSKKMFSVQAELGPPVQILEKPVAVETNPEDTQSKTKVPKTMDDIKSYLFQLRAGAGTVSEKSSSCSQSNTGTKNYQQLFKTKMDSIAKTLSSVAPEEVQTSCEAHMCSIMEFADDFMSPTMTQTGYTSSTPLVHTLLIPDEDSDSVSKLTLPFYTSEQSMSTTITPSLSYDF